MIILFIYNPAAIDELSISQEMWPSSSASQKHSQAE
jgi:hypothetical protein